MAVLDDDKQKPEPVYINPLADDLDLSQEQEIDKTADAFERVAPPRAGRYNLKVIPVGIERNGYELREIKDTKEPYYSGKLELYVVDSANEADNGFMLDFQASTYIGRGKKTCTMAYIMIKSGYPSEKMPESISPKDLVRKFHNWFKDGNKVIKACLCDWQGWSATAQRNVFQGEREFPTDSDGTPQHIVSFRQKGWANADEVIARLKVKDFGADPNKHGSASAGGRPAAPKIAAKAPVVKAPVAKATASVEVEEEAPANVVKAGAKPAKAKPAEVDVDDMLAGID